MPPLKRSLSRLLSVTLFLCAGVGAFSAPPKTQATPAPTAPTASETGTTPVLYLPGSYQGYKPAAAPKISAVAGSTQKFEGYINLPGNGLQSFKFTDAPDWDHINYGDGGDGKLNTDGKASDLVLHDGGYYELTADLSNNTWSATKTTWSIIGDATPGGWDKDTEMTYDPEKQIWSVTAAMKSGGSFKFRANDKWLIDFGLDSAGHLAYVDNPFFPYNSKLNNLTVPADGEYIITLDLHVSGKYAYSITAK